MAVNERDDGGPAFPINEKTDGGNHHHTHAGMSLRDHYAGLAMQGLMQQLGERIAADRDIPRATAALENTARLSFLVADMMIAARAR